MIAVGGVEERRGWRTLRCVRGQRVYGNALDRPTLLVDDGDFESAGRPGAADDERGDCRNESWAGGAETVVRMRCFAISKESRMLCRRPHASVTERTQPLRVASVVSQLHETVRLSSQNLVARGSARHRDAARHAVPGARPHQTRLGGASRAHGRPRGRAVRRVHAQSKRADADGRQRARLGLSVQASRRERRRRGHDSLGAAQPCEPRRRERGSIARPRRQGHRQLDGRREPVPGFPSVPFATLEDGAVIASSTSAACPIRP